MRLARGRWPSRTFSALRQALHLAGGLAAARWASAAADDLGGPRRSWPRAPWTSGSPPPSSSSSRRPGRGRAGRRQAAGCGGLELLPLVAGGAPRPGSPAGWGRAARLGLHALRLSELGLAPATVAEQHLQFWPQQRFCERFAPPGGGRATVERANLELGVRPTIGVQALPREGGDPLHALIERMSSGLLLEQREQAPAPARDLDGRPPAHEAAAAHPDQRASTSGMIADQLERSSWDPVCSGATVGDQRVLSSIRPLTSSTASCTWPPRSAPRAAHPAGRCPRRPGRRRCRGDQRQHEQQAQPHLDA